MALFKSLSRGLRYFRPYVTGTQVFAQASTVPDGPDASFPLGVYCGNTRIDQVFPFPQALDEDAKETVKLMVDPFQRFFTETHDAVKCDLIEDVPKESWDGIKSLGGLGLQVPEKYGGLGLKNTQYARLFEVIGTHDLTFSVVIAAHQAIGYKGIVLFGNDEQKEKYLPSLVKGDKIAAFCLTEPSSGSDANSIRTKAELSDDGKHYVINGSKIYISNGGIADVFTVFAQVPFQKEGSKETTQRVTAFIVERKFGGITSGPAEKKMGLRSSNTTEVFFDDVKVPVENVIGKAGEGFKIAMNILNAGRFAISAVMAGAIRMFTAKAIDHVNNRVQFGDKLISYQSVQEKIARMAMLHYAVESVAYTVSNNMDRGIRELQVDAAISKVFGSESGWYVCDECIQVFGGMGFMHHTGIERFLRDLRIFRIFEGANDVLRLFIASNGIQYAGNVLQKMQQSGENPGASAKLSNKDALLKVTAPELHDSAARLAENIDRFGPTIQKLLLKYGKGIANEQFMLSRLANATIDVYSMAVVLSRATNAFNNKLPSAAHEQLLASTFIKEVSDRVNENLGTLMDKNLQLYSSFSSIAKDISDNNGIVSTRPLRF